MPSGNLTEIFAVDALLVPWPNGETVMAHAGSRSSNLTTFGSSGGDAIYAQKTQAPTDSRLVLPWLRLGVLPGAGNFGGGDVCYPGTIELGETRKTLIRNRHGTWYLSSRCTGAGCPELPGPYLMCVLRSPSTRSS